MRLSITLDPDLHRLAAARAHARRTTLSREINALIRQATSAPAPQSQAIAPVLKYKGRRKFPVVPAARPFTTDDVARIEDDEDLRHVPAPPSV